jgi:hypothetical protein
MDTEVDLCVLDEHLALSSHQQLELAGMMQCFYPTNWKSLLTPISIVQERQEWFVNAL